MAASLIAGRCRPEFAVNSDSSEFTHFLMPLAIICIVLYPVGVNALYVVLLWINRKAIRLEKDLTIEPKAKHKLIGDGKMVSFLHHPYSDQYLWWEVVGSVCAADFKHHSVCRHLIIHA